MRKPETVSPFAALNPQEQKEQWIWWQCQKNAVTEVKQDEQPSASVPVKEVPVAPFVPRHGQYDAVIRRMQNATRQVGRYTSVSSTRQDESGSPKAEA